MLNTATDRAISGGGCTIKVPVCMNTGMLKNTHVDWNHMHLR